MRYSVESQGFWDKMTPPEVETNTEKVAAQLAAIAKEIHVCEKCALSQGRTHAVPGDGLPTAEIMFIGEGPGFHEDRQGLPFVGQSGKFLEELLALIGLNRQQVFITNVVKCRPPENRDPFPVEIDTCTKNYLYRQIEVINPKVIVTLGRHSMGLFFPNGKITAIHGKPKWENGRAYLPMFHPAAVLRNMAGLKPQAEADMRKLPELLVEAKKRAADPASSPSANSNKPADPKSGAGNTPPTQLSMF
jgi:DNA polymerase